MGDFLNSFSVNFSAWSSVLNNQTTVEEPIIEKTTVIHLRSDKDKDTGSTPPIPEPLMDPIVTTRVSRRPSLTKVSKHSDIAGPPSYNTPVSPLEKSITPVKSSSKTTRHESKKKRKKDDTVPQGAGYLQDYLLTGDSIDYECAL